MSIYAFKPRFQALLRPLVRALHRAGVTANQVTLFACVISIAAGTAVALNADDLRWFLLIPVWFFLRMAFNAIDGMLAREHDQRSVLGAYLNELTDVVSDAALYVPFAFLPGVHPLVLGGVVLLAAVSEMTGVLGSALGASRRYDGPMGKSDRAFVFGALGLSIGLGVVPGEWLTFVLAGIGLLVCLTIVNRVRRGIAEIDSRSSA
jgi:CDP-diacylglycerol--glycerol-3-phosphate 3-phosphatidyltransferase